MAQKLTCKRKECEGQRYARKLCENHYRQLMRGVNPDKHKKYNGIPADHLGDDMESLNRNLGAMEAMMHKASAQLKQIAKRVAYTKEHLPDGDRTTD